MKSQPRTNIGSETAAYGSAAEQVSGGEIVARFLDACSPTPAAFGVISIHNMPMLDAIGRRGEIRFVPARGEAGAVNMADAFARLGSGVGVAITSTGTGAGNAAGSLIEARTAGSPVLHITGQVDLPYIDRDCAYLHDAPDQLSLLKSVSKDAFRVWSVDSIVGTLKKAVQIALTPPKGPVSVEIPIDVQQAATRPPVSLAPLPVSPVAPAKSDLDDLASLISGYSRPLLWIGGGAMHAQSEVLELLDLGFCAVSSVSGRGIVPEDHPRTLGSLQTLKASLDFYSSCDLSVVVGSRLRSSDTNAYRLGFPRPFIRIDVDPLADGKTYRADQFVIGDAAATLAGLAQRLKGRMQIEPAFGADLVRARKLAIDELAAGLGPYNEICQILREALPRDAIWVRDVTLANSTWGNRLFPVYAPNTALHAVGGGIGQGLAMGIGAAVAKSPNTKVAVLVGDGGFILNLGELATLCQERANVVIVLMNDRGYGVIRNMQDVRFEGRHYYVDLHTPDFMTLAAGFGIRGWRVGSTSAFREALASAINLTEPTVIEVDMIQVGDYTRPFAGPPVSVAQPRI